MTVGFGWLPDDDDPRDFAFAYAAAAVAAVAPPYEASAEHLFAADPLDQNGHNSCVVQVIAQGMYAAHVKAGHPDPPLLSRHHLWHPCRRAKRAQNDNVGTQMRTPFKVMNALGFCQEKHWPHDLSMGEDAAFRKTPATIAQQMAHDQKQGDKTVYRRIYELGSARLDRLKRSIVAGQPPMFGTGVGRDLANDQIDPHTPIGPPDVIAGKHAMIAGAYHGDDFKVRTSWGEHCDRGWFWMNAKYVADWADIWYIERAPWYSELS